MPSARLIHSPSGEMDLLCIGVKQVNFTHSMYLIDYKTSEIRHKLEHGKMVFKTTTDSEAPGMLWYLKANNIDYNATETREIKELLINKNHHKNYMRASTLKPLPTMI
jgi:hypothetical protein